MTEAERIRQYDLQRRAEGKDRLYSYFEPAQLFLLQRRQRATLEVLRTREPLDQVRILDVGCGMGAELRNFMQYGARPENLYGVDLLPDRIAAGRRLSPHIDLQCGNAEDLPFPDGFFGLAMQFTVFTSILDPVIRLSIAREMLRVLKNGGVVLWYDYWITPNPNARGIGAGEVRRLFPGCHFHFQRLTLAPPLARRVVPMSWVLASALEKVPWLCTHYLVTIRKGRQ